MERCVFLNFRYLLLNQRPISNGRHIHSESEWGPPIKLSPLSYLYKLPAAVIQQATVVGQICLKTSLANLVEEVEKKKIISPSRTAIIFSMEPVFAAIFAMAVIGEFLSLIEWIGGVLIILGVLYSELGPKSK